MEWNNKKVLITGAGGFIGSHLTEKLVKLVAKTKAFVHYNSLGSWGHLDQSDMKKDIEVISGDISDRDSVLNAIRGSDIVFHLAALIAIPYSYQAPLSYVRTNVEGTRNVLDAMNDARVNKLIFFSTVAVYGNSNGPTNESTKPKPNNPYAISKLKAEGWVRKWAKKDLARMAIIIRPTVVFGPYNKGNIYRLIRQIHRRIYIPIGKGENMKSIAYIDNVVAAVLFLINNHMQGVEIFNCADYPHLQYKDIVTLIYSALGRKTPNYYLPLNPMSTLAGISDKIMSKAGIDFSIKTVINKMNKITCHRAEKIRALGFVPRYSSMEGLKRTVQWYIADKSNKHSGKSNEY